MPDNTYKIIEVVGVSDDSLHQAVRNAIIKARKTIRNIDWFEVKDIRGGEQERGSDVPGGSADRISPRKKSGGLSTTYRASAGRRATSGRKTWSESESNW